MIQKNSLIISQYDNFLKSYKDFKLNKTKVSLNNCLLLIQPCFLKWQQDFKQVNFNNNINLLTLFSLIEKDDRPQDTLENKMKNYTNYLTNNSITFLDHLNEAFLMHMQKETILYDNYSKKYKFLFFISQEIKYSLFKIIRKVLQITKRDFFTNPSFFYTPRLFEPFQDINLELYFLFNSNKLLYSIIFSLLYENNTWKNIKNKYKLNNQDYILLKKEANLWINTVLSSN